jgi:hypothetical protein
MTATHRDQGCRTWRFCASVTEAHRVAELAQEVGVSVDLTSVRDGRDGAHAACANSLLGTIDNGIDGYEVSVSCVARPEVVALVWPVIAAAAQGCIAFAS